MCGRYSLSRPEKLAEMIAEVAALPLDFPPPTPRYNVAPSQEVPVIVSTDGRRELARLRWGLVPSWAQDPTIGNPWEKAKSRCESE